jgi:IS4 transposase
MELFPWAKFRKTKAAIKMHTLLDLRGNIPSFIGITDGKCHDVQFLDELPKEPGSFYVMDRAYNDFKRLYEFEQSKSFFVVRAKTNMKYSWRCSRPIKKSSGVRSDQSIVLTGAQTQTQYPIELRRVSYFDKDRRKRLVFLTNNFILAPITIARLYKSRWEVELFFKWVKQHLRIKSFYGTSENAVKTQIWIAISSYLLVAIVRQRLGVERSLYEILKILEILIFEKTHLIKAFSHEIEKHFEGENPNQLLLFDS